MLCEGIPQHCECTCVVHSALNAVLYRGHTEVDFRMLRADLAPPVPLQIISTFGWRIDPCRHGSTRSQCSWRSPSLLRASSRWRQRGCAALSCTSSWGCSAASLCSFSCASSSSWPSSRSQVRQPPCCVGTVARMFTTCRHFFYRPGVTIAACSHSDVLLLLYAFRSGRTPVL